MTSKHLIECVAVKVGLTRKAAEEAVKATFSIMAEALAAKEEVTIANFGKFAVKTRAARTTRNPATGAIIESPEKDVVKFKASKVLLDSAN
ncbi:MAG: HU family DNA-binding protein [Erysipelotrichaceae bacterium]|nr:HU family DNA-binding protein [Erysipelotrichaceae bacterium]